MTPGGNQYALRSREVDDQLLANRLSDGPGEPLTNEPDQDAEDVEAEVGLPDPGRLVAIFAVGLAALGVVELASQQYTVGAAAALVAGFLVLAHRHVAGSPAAEPEIRRFESSAAPAVPGPDCGSEPSGWLSAASVPTIVPSRLVPLPLSKEAALFALALTAGVAFGVLVGRARTSYRGGGS